MHRITIILSALAVLTVVLVTAGTAAAGNAPIKIGAGDLPPVVFPAINPCSGEEQIVTFTPGKGMIQEFETPSGHGHLVLSLNQGMVSTSDGFSGRTGLHLVVNANADSGTETEMINLQVSNADGMRIVMHLVAHATFVNGVPVVEFERSSAHCVGNRNGG